MSGSPNHLHAEHTIAPFAAGAHVLCEKPLATDAAAAQRMIDAAAQRMIDAAAHAQRIGAVAYTYRGYPLVELLRRKVAAGEFGALRRVSGCYLSQDVLAADKYVWMFTPGTTGAAYVLMDLGVHWLHLVEYVTGQRIVELAAQFSTHQRERVWHGSAGEGPRPPGTPAADGTVRVTHTLEEQADLMIRLDAGAAGAVTVSGIAPGHLNTILFSADGPERGFDWNQESSNVWVERNADGTTLHQRAADALPAGIAWMSMLPAGHAEGYIDAFRNVMAQCWAAMRDEVAEYPSFAVGLRGVKLVEAAVESARRQRFLRVR